MRQDCTQRELYYSTESASIPDNSFYDADQNNLLSLCWNETLPAARIADACRRVPRHGHYFIKGFLNPDRVAIVEVDDCAQRLTVVEAVLDANISRHARDTALDPCIRA